ncbi:SMC family ATPase, partial [Candidatus Woesearchaeota archaeon]|nr:SMC family ATPase [Candidatus Woesearchaeota archaeon]
MLLKQLILKNIRSYQDQTILFPQGSTLLAGDIGSGKSSILLALEFALFGALRTDLSADALLRKGEVSGSVELNFVLNKKEISIFRALKRDSTSIKQTPGHIIMDGTKKGLTPLELKAEIIKLLGYPQEFITKSKNYVFRYTVYCPQEEMKRILQELPQERLNILRKIFNIDKYKTIRDNMQTYLKTYRKEMIILETKTEPLETFQLEHKKIVENINETKKLFQDVSVQKEVIHTNILEIKEKIDFTEKEQKIFLETSVKKENVSKQLLDIERQYTNEKERHQDITQKMKYILVGEDITVEKIQSEIESLENEKKEWIHKKGAKEQQCAIIQEKISQLHTQIKEKPSIEEKLCSIEERQAILTKNISQKDIIQKECEQQKIDIQKWHTKITQNNIIISQAQERLAKITNLNECPTCLQEVTSQHKNQVCSTEEDCIDSAQKENEIIQAQKENIEIEHKELISRLDNIELDSRELAGISTKLQYLKEKINTIHEKESILQNNTIMKELVEFNKEKEILIPRIEKRLNSLHDLKSKVLQKEELLLQEKKSSHEILELERRMQENMLQIKQLQELCSTLKDNTLKITQLKEELANKNLLEKEIVAKYSSFETSIKHLQRDLEKNTLVIKEISDLKNILLRKKELYHWLNSYFIQLTYTIEKEVLLRIYHRFNDLFREWFSVLMDDTTISARLNDTFTPVIEQNGHEIDFMHLSGGERTASSLAYRLALNKVINDVVHTIHTKDLLILDEPTDGFSSEQLDKVRDVLERLGLGQIIIVSHESKIESFVENVLR